jgi:hypothetical protein
MPAKRVDQLRALRHQHFARLVMHERRLVLRRAHAEKKAMSLLSFLGWQVGLSVQFSAQVLRLH